MIRVCLPGITRRKLTDDRLLLTGHAVQAQDEWHKGLQGQASRWATVAESHEVKQVIAHLYTCRQRHTLWQLTQQTLISWAVFLNIPVAIIAFCSSPRERTPFFVISARLKRSCQDTFEKEKNNVIIKKHGSKVLILLNSSEKTTSLTL